MSSNIESTEYSGCSWSGDYSTDKVHTVLLRLAAEIEARVLLNLVISILCYYCDRILENYKLITVKTAVSAFL